jgi:hypothetical protein
MADDWTFEGFDGFDALSFTPVPDILFDRIAPRLTEAELRVLLYIMRRTFGFKKRADDISLKQLVEGIRTKDGRVLDEGAGVVKSAAARATKGLVEKGIITAHRNASPERGDTATTYALRFKPDPRVLFENTGVSSKGTGGVPPKEQARVPLEDTQETVVQDTVNKRTSHSELDVLWKATLDDLREQVVPVNFTRWLARTSLLSHDVGTVVVGVPDQVSADQLAKRFDPLVRRALADACGEAVTVRYEVVGGG